jgi:hypothetical protein
LGRRVFVEKEAAFILAKAELGIAVLLDTS